MRSKATACGGATRCGGGGQTWPEMQRQQLAQSAERVAPQMLPAEEIRPAGRAARAFSNLASRLISPGSSLTRPPDWRRPHSARSHQSVPGGGAAVAAAESVSVRKVGGQTRRRRNKTNCKTNCAPQVSGRSRRILSAAKCLPFVKTPPSSRRLAAARRKRRD